MEKALAFFKKNYKLTNFLIKNVIFAFLILIVLHFANFFDINLVLRFRYVVLIVLGFLTFLLFLFFEKDKKEKKKKYEPFLKNFFLVGLFLVAVGSLNPEALRDIQTFNLFVQLIVHLRDYIAALTITSGVLTFCLYFKKISVESLKEARKERQKCEERNVFFDKNFRKINRIPILTNTLKLVYQEGLVYLLLLLIVFILFSTLRVATFDSDIKNSSHYTKFVSTIPTVINAKREGDFFFNYNSFYEHTDIKPVSSAYSRLPLYQWIYYPLFDIYKQLSFTTIIKIVLLAIDIIILFQLYLIFSTIFNKKFALMGIALFSTNNFFQYHFAIPIEDRFGILFFLWGANYLIKKKYSKAYLLGGFSFLAKESFLLIVLPFYIVLELLKIKKTLKKQIPRLIKNLIIFFTPYLLFHSLIKYLPILTKSERIFSIIIACLILVFVFHFLNKIDFSKLKKLRKFFIFTLIPLCGISLYFSSLILNQIQHRAGEFITTWDLVFNWKFYITLLRQVELRFFDTYIWVFIFLGLFILFNNIKKHKEIFALFISSFIYLIISSIGIAFHQYYRHIFVILFISLLILVLHKVTLLYNSGKEIPFKRHSYVILIFLIIFISTYSKTLNNTHERFFQDNNIENIKETAEYLKNNTQENENIIYSSPNISIDLFFLSYRNPANLDNKKTSKLISEVGFKKTLEQYNTQYYVSEGPADFSRLLPLFVENMSVTESVSREGNIKHRLYSSNYGTNQSFDLRSELNKTRYLIKPGDAMKKYNPRQYFELEEIIGDIHIYVLK